MKPFLHLLLLLVLSTSLIAQESEREFGTIDYQYLLQQFPLELQKNILATIPEGILSSGQYQRALDFTRRHMNAKGEVTSREQNWKSVQPLVHAAQKAKGVSVQNGTWLNTGPLNQGGRTLAIAVHPTDSNIVYAGSAGGGVWKSVNGGDSWTPLTDGLPMMTVMSLAINPLSPEEIYAGTGEEVDPLPVEGGAPVYNGNGLYYSRDAGATWIKADALNAAAGSEVLNITGIAVHPNGSTIYATVGGTFDAFTIYGKVFRHSKTRARGPLFRSTDKGVTWAKANGDVLKLPDTVSSNGIIINPQIPELMYVNLSAAMGTNVNYGVWRTTDAGVNWNRLSNGYPVGGGLDSGSIGRQMIAICQQQPNILAAHVADANGNNGRVFVTTDGGDSWRRTARVIQTGGNGIFNDFCSSGRCSGGQGWYDLTIAIKPDNPGRIVVGGAVYGYTNDTGRTWTLLPYGQFDPATHPDQHALAFAPSAPNTVYLGNDGGMYRSDDAGKTFTEKNTDYATTQFYAIDVDRGLGRYDLSYGGMQDNGSRRVPNPGAPFLSNHIYQADGFYVAANYADSTILYAESQSGNMVRSTDGGANPTMTSWKSVRPTGASATWNTPFVMDPKNPLILYYGGNGVWKTLNGAATGPNGWTKKLTPAPAATPCLTVNVAPLQTNFVGAGFQNGKVYISADAGSTWKDCSAGLPTVNYGCSRVAFDRFTSSTVYVTFQGNDTVARIYKSIDTGRTWMSIQGNFPPSVQVNTIINHKEQAPSGGVTNALYIGTDVGIYKSTAEEDASWQFVGENMGPQYVYDIKITPDNRIRVATHGRGIWEMTLPAAAQDPVSVSDEYSDASLMLTENYPNPFGQKTAIDFTLPASSHVTLTVNDALGRTVKTLVDETREAGAHHVTFRAASELPNGFYSCRFTANGKTVSKKMILAR